MQHFGQIYWPKVWNLGGKYNIDNYGFTVV